MITTQLHKMSLSMCKVCFAQKIVRILYAQCFCPPDLVYMQLLVYARS